VTLPSAAPAPAAFDGDPNDLASLGVGLVGQMMQMGEMLSNAPNLLSELQQSFTAMTQFATNQSITSEAIKGMMESLLKSVMPATKADGKTPKSYLLSESQIAEIYYGKGDMGWPRPSDPIDPSGSGPIGASIAATGKRVFREFCAAFAFFKFFTGCF
jgi:hypothetical protein